MDLIRKKLTVSIYETTKTEIGSLCLIATVVAIITIWLTMSDVARGLHFVYIVDDNMQDQEYGRCFSEL